MTSTCAVSGIPITEGDDVRLIMLCKTPRFQRQGENPGGLVHAHDAWMPVSLPLRSTYEDFGQVEVYDPDGFGVESFLTNLREALSPVAAGENPFHDRACSTADIVDMGDVQELCQAGRGRVFVEPIPQIEDQGPFPVGFTLVREEVFAAMTGGYRNLKDEYLTPDDIMETAADDFGRFVGDYDKVIVRVGRKDPGPNYGNLQSILTAPDGIFGMTGAELGLENGIDMLCERWKQSGASDPQNVDALRQLVEMDVFDAGMNTLCRPYAPQMYGNANTDSNLHARIAQMALDHAHDRMPTSTWTP